MGLVIYLIIMKIILIKFNLNFKQKNKNMSQNISFNFNKNLQEKNFETKKKLKESEIFPKSDSFSGSYYKIYQKLRENQTENIFSRFHSGREKDVKYFGAFVNSSQIENVSRCGIPKLDIKQKTSEEIEEDLIYQENLKKYLNMDSYPGQNNVDDSANYTGANLPISSNNELNPKGLFAEDEQLHENKNIFLDLLNLKGSSQEEEQQNNILLANTACLAKSIPQIILENFLKTNHDQGLIYSSLQFEEFLLFNPFKIINYEKYNKSIVSPITYRGILLLFFKCKISKKRK